jgi:hypothetical protein
MVRMRTRSDQGRASAGNRDRGLDRISSATAWTAAGALALTGGFTALAAKGFTGHAGATTPTTRSTTTTTPPAAAVTTPSTAGNDDGANNSDTPSTSPRTTPQTTPQTTPDTQAPQTTPQTSPWQSPDTLPQQQWQPPVSQSGGS